MAWSSPQRQLENGAQAPVDNRWTKRKDLWRALSRVQVANRATTPPQDPQGKACEIWDDQFLDSIPMTRWLMFKSCGYPRSAGILDTTDLVGTCYFCLSRWLSSWGLYQQKNMPQLLTWRFPKMGVPLHHPFIDWCSIINHPAIAVPPF